MTGAPTPGFKRGARRGLVRDAGAAARDRLRPEHRPATAARRHFPRRDRGGRCGSATTSARGRSCWCSRTTTARCSARRCINGLASALGVLSLDAGQGLRDRHRQLRPARHAGDGVGEEGARTSSGTSEPGAADGWHFLTGDQPSIERLTTGRRLPLRVGRGDAAVRAPDRRHRAHARRTAGALPVRHRVRSARSALRARRGVGRQGRHAVDSLLLYCYHYDPMTGRYGLVDHARAARRRRRHRARARRLHRRHGAARTSDAIRAARRPRAPTDVGRLLCGPALRSSPNSASTMAGRVDALYFFLLAALGLLLAADRRPDRLSTRSSTAAAHAGRDRRSRSTAACCSRSPGRSSRSLITMVHLRLGRERVLRDVAAARRNAEHLRRRQAVDVEVPAPRRPARDQRAARAGRPRREADHDVRGRHPRRVRAGVPRQGRRAARPLHAASGSSRPSRAAITCSAPSTAARATRA